MADDLIPPVIRNGGTGSVEVGGIRGPDYRQVQAPEEVNAQGVYRAADAAGEAAAMRARALGGLFKEFEGISSGIGEQASLQAGALAGAASGNTGHPQYKQGLARFTAYGRAFNNAATGAYAIEAEAQADDTAARLRVQANKNPATFAATYTAARDAVLKQAPADAVPMLAELYNKRLAQGIAAIRTDQLTQQRDQQRKIYDEGTQRGISSIAMLQGSENPYDHLEAADEWTKLAARITGGVTSGLYSQAEADAMLVNAHREVTGQVFSTQVDRELKRPDGHVDTLIDNFRQMHLDDLAHPGPNGPVLSEPEFQKLMQDATTKTREYRLFQEMEKQNSKNAEQERYDTGERQAQSLFFKGQLTVSKIDDMMNNKDIRTADARVLYNMLETNAANGKGNTVLYFKLHNSPYVLSMKPADIMRYVGPGGLNGAQADKLADDIERRNNSWEGTQQFKQGRDAIAAALKIPPGDHLDQLDPVQARAYTQAVEEYRNLLNNTEDSKRLAAMPDAAQTVIAHAHQREAAAQVIQLQQDIKSVTESHGPGSGVPWDKDKFDTYIKNKQAAIAAAQAAAKGQ